MRLKTLERHPLFLKPQMLVHKKAQLFDEIDQEIENAIKFRLKQKQILLDKSFAKLLLLKAQNEFIRIRQKISFLDKSIKNAFYHRLNIKTERLLSLKENLNSLDPKNLLKKGYTILFSENRNSLIISASDVKKEDKISAKLFDGELSLVVNHVRLENELIRNQ